MAARLSLFCLVLLIAVPTSFDGLHAWIIWNVGQGQWVTLVDGASGACYHFDAGGERAPWPAIERACRGLANRVTFSHWDLDHISFAPSLRRHLANACVLGAPPGPGPTTKQNKLSTLPPCRQPPPYVSWVNLAGRTSNDLSRVVWWRDVLIPGDSPAAQEKTWVYAFSKLARTRILILGHHGSRTATSRLLLAHLPNLIGAVASSRAARYGHPHARVRRDLFRANVPLLTTEEWNSIYFEL